MKLKQRIKNAWLFFRLTSDMPNDCTQLCVVHHGTEVRAYCITDPIESALRQGKTITITTRSPVFGEQIQVKC